MPLMLLEDSFDPGEPVNERDDHRAESHEDRTRPAGRRRKATVIDGPFTESKELLGGQWPPGWVRR